jgi:hypothetical protein
MFEVYKNNRDVYRGNVNHYVHFPWRAQWSECHRYTRPESAGDLHKRDIIAGWLLAGVKMVHKKLDLVRLAYNRYMDDHHPDYYLIRNAKQAERVRNRGRRY